jgi:hypothetical protein
MRPRIRVLLIAMWTLLVLAKLFAAHDSDAVTPLLQWVVLALELTAAVLLLLRPSSRLTSAWSLLLSASLLAGNSWPITRLITFPSACGCLGPFEASRYTKQAVASWLLLLSWIHHASPMHAGGPSVNSIGEP